PYRTNTYQFHLAFQHVDKLWYFINPVAAEYAAPGCKPEIVGRLARVGIAILLQHIVVEVFGIGVHSTELIYSDHFTMLSDSLHFEQGTIAGIHIVGRGLNFLYRKIEESVNRFHSLDFK